jgi:hypothetical protein
VLQGIENEARERPIGLWADPHPVPPREGGRGAVSYATPSCVRSCYCLSSWHLADQGVFHNSLYTLRDGSYLEG